MNIESQFELSEKLILALKNKEFDNEKIELLINLVTQQNELSQSIFEFSIEMAKINKDAIEKTNILISKHKEILEFVKVWLEAQNSRNDSVDTEFTNIEKSLLKINQILNKDL